MARRIYMPLMMLFWAPFSYGQSLSPPSYSERADQEIIRTTPEAITRYGFNPYRFRHHASIENTTDQPLHCTGQIVFRWFTQTRETRTTRSRQLQQLFNNYGETRRQAEMARMSGGLYNHSDPTAAARHREAGRALDAALDSGRGTHVSSVTRNHNGESTVEIDEFLEPGEFKEVATLSNGDSVVNTEYSRSYVWSRRPLYRLRCTTHDAALTGRAEYQALSQQVDAAIADNEATLQNIDHEAEMLEILAPYVPSAGDAAAE